jgi:porphobilinogen synthase
MLRNRQTAQYRRFLSETTLTKSNLIFPLFINETLKEKKAVVKMPGVYQQSPSSLLPEVERLAKLGIQSIILFGIPAHKDKNGECSYDENGIVQVSLREIKKKFPEMLLIADCCLCEYTSNGHCGIMHEGRLNNDATLNSLQRIAVSYANSGADVIAPSGMMDGMIRSIREGLDEHEFEMIPIMSYAAKFASQFYGPFREAAGSEDNFLGDRKHHQLSPTQKREAVRDAILDIEEGADFLMVKPALHYLDIIKTLRDQTLLPITAYHTSGEYAMLKAALKEGMIANEVEAFYETLISIRRAGADHIITYYGDEIAKHL